MTDRDQSVAVHEAAHFVIGFVLATGMKHSVTIEPAGDIEGEASGEFPNVPDDGAVEFLAGLIAQRRVDPHVDPSVAHDDEVQAAELLQLGTLSVKSARERAEHLVSPHWSDIKVLAEELVRHRTLDGEEAELIIEAARGDRDPRQALTALRALKKAAREAAEGR
jgi:ATP-dependent Zn protease